MNIWLLAVLAGFGLMVTVFVTLILINHKKGNIDYIICQTFLGGQKWYASQGMVDVKNDGTYMAEHIILNPRRLEIGLFHQKHLKAHRGNRYLMLLEEWDTGRYRPLEYRGHMKGTTTLIRKLVRKDEAGKPLRDNKGKIQFYEVPEEIDYGTLIATPNHDIDYIVQRKERNRKVLLKREEKLKWLPAVAAGAIFILAGIMLIVSWMYLAEYSENMENAARHFDEGKYTQDITRIIRDTLFNETTTVKVKDTTAPPSAQAGAG